MKSLNKQDSLRLKSKISKMKEIRNTELSLKPIIKPKLNFSFYGKKKNR